MTNGRYTIRRAGDKKGGGKKGLDLTVEDAHTGRNRVPASLSGGEQFQASLALALGLADVLSRAGSTRSHGPEALFIDEGLVRSIRLLLMKPSARSMASKSRGGWLV